MKKNKKIIDNTHLFKQRESKKQARMDDVERHNALFQARKIWDDWMKRTMIGHMDPSKLPSILNELAAMMEKDIRHPEIRSNIIDMVQGKMVEAFGRNLLDENIVRALMDCQHVADEVGSPCGWGGQGLFGKKQWDEGTVEHTCPECGSKLTKADMILAIDLPKPEVNRIAKYVHSRVVKNKPPEVFPFTTVEELKALPFVKAAMAHTRFSHLLIEDKYLNAIFDGDSDSEYLQSKQALGIIEFPTRVKL